MYNYYMYNYEVTYSCSKGTRVSSVISDDGIPALKAYIL